MITGVILTRNEELNIVSCIEHLRPHVAEIILIDTESTDRTVELAKPLVDRVLSHPHVSNFDSARNIAIPVARYDWLWFVDADEQIPPLTGQLVRRWIQDHGSEFEAINIPFKSYFCGRWMRHCGWWPGYTCSRVLKRGHFAFSSTLHGGVELSGREFRAPADEQIGVEHYSFRDLHHWVEKFNRYTSTEALQLAQQGYSYDWRSALRSMVHDLWEHYELHDARRDGERGWILTWCAAQYRWFSVSKLIDHGQSPEQAGRPSSVPADLDEFVLALEEELAWFRAQRPTLPLGVVWRAPFFEDTAAAAESRHCVLEIAKSRRPMTAETLTFGPEFQPVEHERVLLRALERARRSQCVVSVTQWTEVVVPPDRCATYNVLRVPAGAGVSAANIPSISAYDELWVETAEQELAVRQWGAAPERTNVVPSLLGPPARSEPANGPTGQRLERLIQQVEASIEPRAISPPLGHQVRVAWEGEFFAGHSFSNINEQLSRRLVQEPTVALALHRVRHQRTQDRRVPHAHDLAPYFGRALDGGTEVTIRHAFPPNWQRPTSGKWVHIQPWEFGYLPNDWIGPLRDQVDEIWVMSRYVERVYRASGVAPQKLHYVPWGVDPKVFRPDVPARRLTTDKSFRFLYVGGTIPRKGFDRVLSAYLTEFSRNDDVCLVVKDMGTSSFYAPNHMRAEIHTAQREVTHPEIIYFDEEMTAGQLASLYRTCQCLVAPYRGEGFGLPVLEALACGVPPIVPRGGPTDDFVDTCCGFLLPSAIIPAQRVTNLCGPSTEFEVNQQDLRAAMRSAYEDLQHARRLGLQGSQRVHAEFTWDHTVRAIVQRLHALASRTFDPLATGASADSKSRDPSSGVQLAACIHETANAGRLIESLARVGPFVETMVVQDERSDPRIALLAREYGARLVEAGSEDRLARIEWCLALRGGEYLDAQDLSRLGAWLHNVPDHVARVGLKLQPSQGHSSAGSTSPETRVIRIREPVTSQELEALVRRYLAHEVNGHQAVAPFLLRRVADSSPAQKIFPHEAYIPARNDGPQKEIGDAVSKASRVNVAALLSPPTSIEHRTAYGRLRKSVLIQMATGLHQEFLQLTGDHHRQYARRHGLDYWCLMGDPAFQKRPGWGKVPLLLAGIAMGYESVVWLDADAVIVRPEINLATVSAAGIGMVRHPQPEHWNTGLIVARAASEVERFWRQVDAAPENNSAWMEQAAANALAARPEFAGLLHPLELRFNSVPGFAMAPDPVVIAAHGLPHHERLSILTEALANHRSGGSFPADVLSRREDFGDFLNRRGLIGHAAEVGVYRGEFARVLLDRWHGQVLHLVDPWRHLSDYDDIANSSDAEHQANLEAARRHLAVHSGRIRIHRTLSAGAVGSFADASLDFVYLDANHAFEAVWQDLHLWYPKIRSGGILAGHDFLDGDLPEGRFGVASAVEAFHRETGLVIHLTDDPPWRSWYFDKP